MALFSRETLKYSIRPIVFIVLVCLVVMMWGRHRTVDVTLSLRPEIQGHESGVRLDMTVYRGETESDVAADFSVPLAADRIATQRLSLHPGIYEMRGIVTTQSGQTHIVRQTIVVPEDDASIELYLRE